MQSNVVCYSIGELPYLVWVQKQVSATPLKVHIFKKSKGQNIKIDFLENCFLNCLYYAQKNQIFHKKNLFETFLFSKKGTFSKKSIAHCSGLIVENNYFFEFHTGI